MVETSAPLYCCGTPSHMEALRECGIYTVSDMVTVVRADVEGVPHIHNPPCSHSVYKKHVIGFLRSRRIAVFVDFDRLLNDRIFLRGGAYPDQWFSLNWRLLKKAEPAAEPAASPPTLIATNINGELPEEEALAEAIRQSVHIHELDEEAFNEGLRQSVESMPPSPVLKTTSTTCSASSSMTIAIADNTCMNAPDELCCPITCCLMQDPVRTLRGQAYERCAIEDWFRRHATEPMTGERVIAKAVFPDDDLKNECDAYRRGVESARAPIKGAGRRGGRGGRGGRGICAM